MSWAGILERIQIDAIELLSNPVDSNKLDRKYVLALASLLDEEVALQVLQNRKSAGWCSSWLCSSIKKISSPHDEQHKSAIHDNDHAEQITLLVKTSVCCSDRCKATLKVLLQRAIKDFDPSSREVAQALFKIFPNAESGLLSLSTLSTGGDSSGSISKNCGVKMTSSPSLAFEVKEKGFGVGSVSQNNNTNNNDDNDDDKDVVARGWSTTKKAPLGTSSNAFGGSTSLLFSALDPRISVVVLADLLLPSSLKQKWTLQLAKLNNGHPVQRQLLSTWLESCFGSNATQLLSSFLQKCSKFASTQPADALDKILSQNDNSIAIQQQNQRQQHDAKIQHNRFRARTMAYDILSNLVLEETKRAALLLRFESELPTEFREKIEEFIEVAALPTPIPYEDSKDTWLLFIVMLFVVSALTDPRFAALFLQNVVAFDPSKKENDKSNESSSSRSTIRQIFEAFCIDHDRAKEILEAFFAV